MAVTRSCTADAGTVILKASQGEYIEYRIPSASPGVTYTLVNEQNLQILSDADCAPPCTRRWPPGAAAAGTTFHTLSIQFFGNQSLDFEIDHKDGNDAVLMVLRRCRYENAGDPGSFVDPLEIIVQ